MSLLKSLEVKEMYSLISLTKRHILIFLRDKTAVFFSFLSVLILLTLYFLFIGRQFTSGSEMDLLNENLKTYLVAGVMMGGVIVINTMSLSLGMMGSIINDMEYRKLDGFLVTPVKRYKIILSYYISSIIVTTILTLFMWALTILYVGVFSGYWYSLGTILLASLYIFLFTIISSSIMIFLTTLLKSVNAFGTMSGILGTLIGFVSGIYMPLVVLGKSMAYVASLVPFTHMAIILKNVLLKGPYEELSLLVPSEAMTEISAVYGTTEIGILGAEVSMIWIMLASVLFALTLLFFAYRRLNQKMGK